MVAARGLNQPSFETIIFCVAGSIASGLEGEYVSKRSRVADSIGDSILKGIA
jgi:hypothetical protein